MTKFQFLVKRDKKALLNNKSSTQRGAYVLYILHKDVFFGLISLFFIRAKMALMQNEWVKWLKQKMGKATNRCHPREREDPADPLRRQGD